MPDRSSIIQLYIIWTVRSIVGDIDPLSSSRRLVISLHGKMLQQSISQPEMKISIISAMFIDNSTMMCPPYRTQPIGNVRETYRNKKKNEFTQFQFFSEWMRADRLDGWKSDRWCASEQSMVVYMVLGRRDAERRNTRKNRGSTAVICHIQRAFRESSEDVPPIHPITPIDFSNCCAIDIQGVTSEDSFVCPARFPHCELLFGGF